MPPSHARPSRRRRPGRRAAALMLSLLVPASALAIWTGTSGALDSTSTTSTTATRSPTDGTGLTYWGASPGGLPGETPAQAFTRIDGAFGGLDAVRWWPADGSVPSWSSLPTRFGKRAVAMSMKMPPADVAAGKYDAALATFFRTAPQDRMITATFFHEPEDDIAHGAFTFAQYRAAWTRFSKIANANKPANVRTAMILMHGTFRNTGYYGHPWQDYVVPGTFEVLGADVYQFLTPHVATATEVVKPQIDAARSLGIPFAIMELGTRPTSPDRAQFLRDVITLVQGRALMVLAYESYRGTGGPWNIIDVAPDAEAVWRAVCMRH